MHALDRNERFKYDNRCDTLLGEAITALAAYDGALDPSTWRVIGHREQLTVHRSITPFTPNDAEENDQQQHCRQQFRVLATGYMNGSFLDITDGLYADTDQEFMTVQSILSPQGCIVLDAAVLLVSERQARSTPSRFAGVKWCAWQSGTTNKESRDLLTYERMGRTLDDQGLEVAYHVMESMQRPDWPLLQRRPGLKRLELSLCFLFRKICDDIVECFVVGNYPARSSASMQRSIDTVISERVLLVAKALQCCEAKRLSAWMDKTRHRPILMGKSCLRCGSKRTILDQHRNCGICKKSVCHRCRKAKTVFKLNDDTRKPEIEAFCYKCMQRAQLPDTTPPTSEKMKANHRIVTRERSKSIERRASLTETHEYNYDELFRRYAMTNRTRHRASMPELPLHNNVAERPANRQPFPLLLAQQRRSESAIHQNGHASTGQPLSYSRTSHHEHNNKHDCHNQEQLVADRQTRETVLSYPLAKTLLAEDIYLPDAPNQEAEKKHQLYLERQKKLTMEQESQSSPMYEQLLRQELQQNKQNSTMTRTSKIAKSGCNVSIDSTHDDVVKNRASTYPLTTSSSPKALKHEEASSPNALSTQLMTKVAIHSSAKAQSTFRMDLYGRFGV